MKYYLDIILLSDTEIPIYFLWEKVYQQLHLALVENQNADSTVPIGIAFPEYNDEKNQLGNKLRLFAPSSDLLKSLAIKNWLSRLNDYVNITDIHDVPENIESYARFKRLQPKSNNERLARRLAKRKGITLEQALAHYETREETNSRVPFIYINSLSSNKRYRLFIAREVVDSEDCSTGFSTYSLSSTSTVPVF